MTILISIASVSAPYVTPLAPLCAPWYNPVVATCTDLIHGSGVIEMKRNSIHVTLPNSLNAMVTVEADKSGDTLAAVVRRCIRATLSSHVGTKEYDAEFKRLRLEHPEEE